MTTDTIITRHASLATLLAAVLGEGHAVSFTQEPLDGIVCHIDTFTNADVVSTDTGIAADAYGALAAAASTIGIAAGEPADLVFSDDVLADRVGALENKLDMLSDELRRGRVGDRSVAGEFPCCKHCEHYGDDSEWHGAPCGACADEADEN
jgi:hypothetical protein